MADATGQLERLHTALRANGHSTLPQSVEGSLDILLGMGRKRKRSDEPSVAQTIRASIAQRVEARLASIDKRTLLQLCRELDNGAVEEKQPSEASIAAAHEATEKLLL